MIFLVLSEYSTVQMYDGTTVKSSGHVYFNKVDKVRPGTPCIVESTATKWEIDLAGRTISGEIDNNAALKGTYSDKVIGTGYFKVSADGKTFTNTVSDSKVYEFRVYLDLKASSSMGAGEDPSTLSNELSIEWIDDATDINSISTVSNKSADVFDLAGRKVEQTVKGNIYISNGKKFIAQ